MNKTLVALASAFIIVGFIGMLLTGFNIDNTTSKAFDHQWEYGNTKINNIEIVGRSENVEVTFKTSASDDIYITAWGKNSPEIIEQIIQSSVYDDTFTINLDDAESRHWISFGFDNTHLKVEIALPSDKLLNDVQVGSKSGNITINQLNASTAELKTNSGHIEVNDSKVGFLKANHTSGNLKIGQHQGDITSRTASGKIIVAQLSGNSEVSTDSGDIEIEQYNEGQLLAHSKSGNLKLTQHIGGNVEAKTISGDIRLTLGSQFAGSVNVLTKSGHTSLPDNLVFASSGQTHHANLKTTSGNIKVLQ